MKEYLPNFKLLINWIVDVLKTPARIKKNLSLIGTRLGNTTSSAKFQKER